MRCTIAVVVLLLLASVASVLAADPPGGPGWYQLDISVSVAMPKGTLVITAGTPGQLVSFNADGTLMRIRFERGLASWLGSEITSGSSAENASLLTVDVDPQLVRALLKQLLSRTKPPDDSTPPRTGGAEPGALGALAGTTGAGVTSAGAGTGTRGIGVQRETTVVIDDTLNIVRRGGGEAAVTPGGQRSGVQVFPPSASGAGGGGAGGPGRVIAREEHDAWLAKVLRLWGEDAASCETKAYGPGWISICDPRREA